MHRSRFHVAVILPVVVSLAGCVSGWIDRKTGIAETRQVQAIGESAQATILRIADTGMTLNKDPVVDFLLDVRREGQSSYQARTRTPISRLDVPRFQPGAVVPVRVDPQNPHRVALDAYTYK